MRSRLILARCVAWAAWAAWAVCTASTVACGSGGLETATEMPRAPRRPDGVVIEPTPALPPVQERAAIAPVLALREPALDREVEDVVRGYLGAFEREDIGALQALVSEGATPLGRPGGKSTLVELWRGRFKTYEYQRLAGTEIARFAQLERRGYDGFGEGGPPRPAEMRPGDVLVRVPIAMPRVNGEQLFGDVLVLLLRRENGKLVIVGQADESGAITP